MYIDVNKFINCACDSDMIQMALDEARLTGESVVIPKKNKRTGKDMWEISRTVYLYDTFGISVSNVMTHSRFAVWINNTLKDSSFENIRLFGNGYMAAYFGEGEVENLRFSNISYDRDCKPLKDDEHIWIEWNKTKADGLSCVYFNGTQVKNVSFRNLNCAGGMESVFGGFGSGNVICKDVAHKQIGMFSNADGIEVIVVYEENRLYIAH